jgi:hypothetical protein
MFRCTPVCSYARAPREVNEFFVKKGFCCRHRF